MSAEWFLIVIISGAVSISDPLTFDECTVAAQEVAKIDDVTGVRCFKPGIARIIRPEDPPPPDKPKRYPYDQFAPKPPVRA